MRLTDYTDYSLRVLMFLALRKGRLSTIDQISRAYEISPNHLMKIVQHLGKLGHIETVRGRGGGIRLAAAPEDISVGQVVRQVEPHFRVVECFDEGHADDCAIAPACRLRGIMGEAVEAFLATLDRYTVADLLRNPRKLGELLEIQKREARSQK